MQNLRIKSGQTSLLGIESSEKRRGFIIVMIEQNQKYLMLVLF